MRRYWIALALSLLLVAGCRGAGHSGPYAGLDEREIKALSAEQIAAYEAGEGMGFALAAELNGYPGPKHVLELRQGLQLTPMQTERTTAVFEEMRTRATELGREIVGVERELDGLFASGGISEESLTERVGQSARLQGRLRAVHLSAHLQMMEILTADQIARYASLRGYHGGGAHHGRGH